MAAMMIPFALQAGSTLLSMKSSLDQGEQAMENAYETASELEDQGDAALAASTRKAAAKRREGDRMASNAQAAMAAGGGVTDDAGALETFADIDERSQFNSLAALFEGKTARQGKRRQARITRREGRQAYKAGRTRAFASALSGGSQMFDTMP